MATKHTWKTNEVITASLLNSMLDYVDDKVSLIPKGPDGKSAYEVAVANGYTGTESEWLSSLKGLKGDTGAKGEQGAVGPMGVPGKTGAQGPSGKSAYEIAVDSGYTGTQEEWVASLKGQKGDKGDPGEKGEPGDGADVDLTPYVKKTDADKNYASASALADVTTTSQVQALIKEAFGDIDGFKADGADGSGDNYLHFSVYSA